MLFSVLLHVVVQEKLTQLCKATMSRVWASQVVLVLKNLPAKQETQETRVPSLGWGDPLEEGMATPSSVLVWGIPWTEKPGGLQSKGSQRVRHN